MKRQKHRYRPTESVASAIRAFREVWKRKTDQDDIDKPREHRWHKREVYGLWAAAGVGVAAIIVSSFDSHHQKEVMQRQLDEMRAEQRPNLWVVSDVGAPSFVAAGGQIIWTVHLTNYGKNFVVRGTVHKFMLLGDSGFTPSYGEPKDVLIMPVAPGQVITYTVVSLPGVTSERLSSLLAISGGIQIKLAMEYQDLAGTRYRSTVHLTRTNAGSIAFGPESHIE